MNTEQERADFEAWYRDTYNSTLYCEARFEGWQAGRAALQSQDREDDPLQPAVNWLLKAAPDSFPNATELQAQLMIGYNRAKRLFDHARRIEGDGK